ncbi:hypothetical protein SALBM311S_10475 [Streptomyces alboniger]
MLTNAVRYADPGQHRLADVLDAARLLRPVDHRHLDGGERWLKDPAAMTAAADRIAQAVGDDPARAARLLAETEATGQSCTLTPADLGLGRPHFPDPPSSAPAPSTVRRCGCCGSGVRPGWPPAAWTGRWAASVAPISRSSRWWCSIRCLETSMLRLRVGRARRVTLGGEVAGGGGPEHGRLE